MSNTGFVYWMTIAGHNVYKIGATINLEKRIARKQKKHDYKLEYVDHIEVDIDVMYRTEDKLHKWFERYRVGNDWFALSDYVVANLDSYALEARDQANKEKKLFDEFAGGIPKGVE